MSKLLVPQRLLCGANVPDTPVVKNAMAFARSVTSESIYNHVVRSLILGFIIADKLPALQSRDREVHAVAAILHDIGLPLGQPPHSELISSENRFEVDGANAARKFLLEGGDACQWPSGRLQLVWDAIALHAIGSIAKHKEPEVQACTLGIRADFFGPDRMPDGLLTWDEYEGCLSEYPRLDLMNNFKENMLHLCQNKPETTWDNTVGEWGDRYLVTAEYNRKPHLMQNILEQFNLNVESKI